MIETEEPGLKGYYLNKKYALVTSFIAIIIVTGKPEVNEIVLLGTTLNFKNPEALFYAFLALWSYSLIMYYLNFITYGKKEFSEAYNKYKSSRVFDFIAGLIRVKLNWQDKDLHYRNINILVSIRDNVGIGNVGLTLDNFYDDKFEKRIYAWCKEEVNSNLIQQSISLPRILKPIIEYVIFILFIYRRPEFLNHITPGILALLAFVLMLINMDFLVEIAHWE